MADKKPSILHINTEKTFRGGEIQTLEIAKRLYKRGFPTLILANEMGELIKRAEKENLPTIGFNPKGELDLFSALKIRKIVKGNKIDIVTCHTSMALGIVYLSKIKKSGVKIVGIRRVSFPLKSKKSLLKYKNGDKIVAVSEVIGKSLFDEGVPAEKITVIHSGFDIKKFENLPDPHLIKERLGVSKNFPVIGVVGALAHHKGHRTLIKALERVWIVYPTLIAIFVGEGDAKKDLERSTASKAIPTLFTGFVENVAPIYRSFDIFVLPSSSGEGSPAVIKEAAASEVPVVATNVGGVDEILRHNIDALLVPPSDPDKLSKAILFLCEDKEAREALKINAKQRVKSFDFEFVADAYEKLYSDLLKR